MKRAKRITADGFDLDELELAIKLSLEGSYQDNPNESWPRLNEWRVLTNRLGHNIWGSGATFDDLIQLPDGCRPYRALVTSFNEDIQWILGKFQVWKGTCDLAIINSEPTATPHRIYKNVRVYGPPLGAGHSIMHAKLIVLRFPGRARIVVSTNNANGFEWTGIGLMCCAVDLPLGPSAAAPPSGEGAALRDFLVKRMGWCDDGILRGVDFTHMSGAAFVPSWPGSLDPGDAAGGFPALRKKAFSLVPELAERCAAVTFFTSSMGHVTKDFLAQFPCCGAAGKRGSRGGGGGPKIAVCFHTEEDVAKAARAGLEGEGLLCFNEQFARSPGFCRDALHEVVWKDAGRAPTLSHVKLIVWADGAGSPLLAYVGSHNLSKSAWGFSRGGKVQMNNYELGVLVKEVRPAAIPFVLPAPPYAAGRDHPWTTRFN